MVTKGIIKSIDLLGNTCTVHIPFFETAGNDPIFETATVSNTPGSYNGYKVGDAVYVAFEDGNMSTPVIIGKLYLGVEKEKADPRGVSNVMESSIAQKATLPADSKLMAKLDTSVPNTTVPYNSLSSIANGLNKLNTEVAQNDRDYGNRFKQVISSIDVQGTEFSSSLEQTSKDITAKVEKETSDRETAIDNINKNKLDSKNTGKTYNEGDVIKKYGFGWDLNDEAWTIKAYDQTEGENLPDEGLDIFKITRDTVEINAPNVKLAGYPRVTTVRYAYGGNGENDYPRQYKEGYSPSVDDEAININNEGNAGWTLTELPYNANATIWQWTQTAKYEYNDRYETWAETIDDKVVKLAINENLVAVNTTIDNTKKALQQGIDAVQVNLSDVSDTLSKVNDKLSNDIKDTLAIAQGKTTNYYSSTDPSNNYTIKVGDCWFDTTAKTLKQCTGITNNVATWEDIGGELVANKVTATFINALDITAKKIDVVGTNSKTIFKADGLATDTNGNPAPSVIIGGFNVTQSALTAGSDNSTIGLQTASTSSAVVINNKTYHKVNYIENIPTQSTSSNPYIKTNLKDVLNFSSSFTIEIEFMPLENTVTTDIGTTTDKRCCLLSSYASTDAKNKRQNISFEIKNNQLRCYVGSITGNDTDKIDFSVGQVKVGAKNKARIRVSSSYIQASLNGTASPYTFFKSTRTGALFTDPAIFTDSDKRVLFSVPLRIYSLKVWVGGILTANIIPAVEGHLGQLIDIQNGKVLGRRSSSSSSSDSLFKTGYPAFFLGAADAVEAPFSVSNIGEVRAYTGDIGGFVLTDSSISSDNGLLQLYSDGTFTAKSGNIGGWTLAETGFSSDNIKLAPRYLQVGDARLYEEDSTNNRLIIKGAGGKAGFRIGRAEDDLNYNLVKIKASIAKQSNSWILTLGPQDSTNNKSIEGEVLSVYVLGTKSLRFGRTEEICRTITWPIEAGATIVNQQVNLTIDFELSANYSCYIAWTESGVQNKPSATEIYKTITQATNQGRTGLNESYAPILPYYKTLSLGSTEAAWSAIYVKNLYYEKMSQSSSLNEPNRTPPSTSGTPTVSPGACFDAGTKVLMADGTSKNIEDIQKGDKIHSYNTQTNTYNSEEVLGVMQLVSSQNLVLLTFEDGTQLYTTTTHPFYTTAGWVSLNPSYDYSLYEDISDDYFELMTVGQTFYKVNYNSSQPEFVKLSRIQYRHGVSKDHIVYNLDVSNNNTFFANGILGHNALTKMTPKD